MVAQPLHNLGGGHRRTCVRPLGLEEDYRRDAANAEPRDNRLLGVGLILISRI